MCGDTFQLIHIKITHFPHRSSEQLCVCVQKISHNATKAGYTIGTKTTLTDVDTKVHIHMLSAYTGRNECVHM